MPSLFLHSKLLEIENNTKNAKSTDGLLKISLSQNQNPGFSIAQYSLNI
jgi:hypothetical protein